MKFSITETLLSLAHSDERAVLFTVIEGEQEVGRKLLVLTDRGAVVGDAPLGLAPRATRLSRTGPPRALLLTPAGHRGLVDALGLNLGEASAAA